MIHKQQKNYIKNLKKNTEINQKDLLQNQMHL